MIVSLAPLLYVLAVSIVVTPRSHAVFSNGMAYNAMSLANFDPRMTLFRTSSSLVTHGCHLSLPKLIAPI